MNTKSEYTYIDKWARKIIAINYLGGRCKECGEDNIFVLCFHHKDNDDKKTSISKMTMAGQRWSQIRKEVDKCDLLCQNCHRESHQNKDDTERKNGKIRLLEIKGNKFCEKCGYDKCNDSLVFHHKVPGKNYNFGDISKAKNISIAELENEMRKCDLICSNCHSMEHINMDNFNRLRDRIYQKVNNLKEKQSALPISEVLQMWNNGGGMRQIEIARHFTAAKSTICGIIKRHGELC